MSHSELDQISLLIAQRVAQRLREQPDAVEVARKNLDRWSRVNSGSPSLLHCYAEWRAILGRPLNEICEILCAETDEGQRLRQNSPFPGVLSPSEVWDIKSRFRHAATPA